MGRVLVPVGLLWLMIACTSQPVAPTATPLDYCDMIGPEISSGAPCDPAPTTALAASPEAPDRLSTTRALITPDPGLPGILVIGTEEPPTNMPVLPRTTETLLPTVTLCASGQCYYPGTLTLARPIAPPDNDLVDGSYRFGSTQGKQRDPHHGVEFLNPQGTPVLAAGDGKVILAGNDKTTRYSPYFNYYGNLVVIEHDATALLRDNPAFPIPLYTLYAHLSEILVEPGQQVTQGQEIGRVGMTGGATGSHLHFEVRLGENTYQASHNPELWLAPKQSSDGQLQGALVVRVLDRNGQPIAVQDVVLQYLPDGSSGTPVKEIYLQSYEEKALLGRPPWQESFAAGDLDPGWYRVSFPYFGLQRQEFQVLPGQISVVVFQFE